MAAFFTYRQLFGFASTSFSKRFCPSRTSSKYLKCHMGQAKSKTESSEETNQPKNLVDEHNNMKTENIMQPPAAFMPVTFERIGKLYTESLQVIEEINSILEKHDYKKIMEEREKLYRDLLYEMKGITTEVNETEEENLSKPLIISGLSDAIARKSWVECLHLIKEELGIKSHEYRQLQYVNEYPDVLNKAVEKNFTELIELLKANYSNLELLCSEDTNMLISAVEKNDFDKVKLLVERGADIYYKDEYGQTLLHRSAINGSYEIVSYLLDKGLNINAKDCMGHTPLTCAARFNNLSVVSILLKDIYCDKDALSTFIPYEEYFYTALDWAKVNRNGNIVNLLEEHDCLPNCISPYEYHRPLY